MKELLGKTVYIKGRITSVYISEDGVSYSIEYGTSGDNSHGSLGVQEGAACIIHDIYTETATGRELLKESNV